jgi:hypothetical protein
MQAARSQFWREGSSGHVSEKALQQLRSSLLQYYDVLREFRGEKAIKEEWSEKEFDRFPDMVSQEVVVKQSTSGHGSGTQRQTVPYIKTLSGQELVDLSYELDDIANKLGFSASVDEHTSTTQVTQELVKKADERAKELKEEV